ncbi:virulence-associated protein E [Brucellaceae bacterium VT-16-1752]|nr:virulence-associated protein E [Brucellaceae bacterium VT-16-1752]
MPDIHSAAAILGGKAKGNRILCPGPGHSKNDRSLKVTFRPDGGFSVTSFAGDDWQTCKDYVKARLGLSDDQPVPFTVSVRSVSTGRTKARAEALARLWASCIPIEGTPAEVYLKRRGLSYDGDAWRYRPTSGSIVAIVTDALTADPIGWHETMLDHDGNKLGRRMHGNVSGGAVRLYDSDILTGLAVAEGIETAIASDMRPVWACLSASVLMNFPVIPGVECLTVLADHDEAGIAAANAVGRRWHEAGREVILTMPAKYGTDFADREAA